MADRQRIGDRVELAIEEHADAEREISRGEQAAREHPPRRLRRTVFWLALTGISLYLVAPSVLEVARSAKDIDKLAAGWLGLMVVVQAAALASLWVLQRLAVHAARLSPVATSQLAGNALAKVAPGGGAIGAALQYRMLVAAGERRESVVSGLTASNLLTLAVVLAMPVLAVPALFRGSVNRTLLEAAITGVVLFAVLAAIGAAMLALDRPLRWVGRRVQGVRNRLRRHSEPLRGLPDRLIAERNRILATLGPRWKRALMAAVARWAFDYATLLAALAAVGAHARPALVLLAFCAAQLLAQIPVTPGGLGFVEAGLTGMLTLAGVDAGDAVLVTFAYRLVSYWLPMPVGLAAWVVHRRRYA